MSIKLIKHISLLCALYVLLSGVSSCTKEQGIHSTGKLYVSAVSVPFAPERNATTKTLTNGFLTTFESGDVIGVTGIDANGNILEVCNNVKFIYNKDTLISGVQWATFLNDRGYPFVERVDGATYFAYYPYSDKWNGKTLDEILTGFDVEADQRTKENFDKSDLMTPETPIAPSGGILSFEMKHQMSTISLFYNNEWEPDGVTPLYPIRLYQGTSPASLKIENTYRAPISDTAFELRHRYLVNPRKTPTVKLVGYLEEKSIRLFSNTIEVQPGVLYSVSFEGEPLVPYTDGVDLGLDKVKFEDRFGNIVTLGHTVMWSKYNLGESKGESYPFEPAPGDRGAKTGSRDPYARGDYYCWGATYTQYNNGLTGYNGYGYNNYFDKEYKVAPLGGTIKETEYDVAHAKWWRGKWRLPTENEFRAMFAGCTFEKVDSYTESQQRYMGAPGSKRTFSIIKVTSKVNGNFIYLSTGGYFDGTIEPEKDAEGNFTPSGDNKFNQGNVSPDIAYYMSSTASPTILKCISYAYINENKQAIQINGSRYTGMLVRPVYSPNENKNE